MTQFFLILFSFLSFGLSFSMSVHASETYYVAPTTGVSVEESVKLSIYDLTVANIKEMQVTVVKDATGAQFQIDTQVIKLGNSYIVTMQKSQSGSLKLSKKMKVSTVDELDKAVQRLSSSMISETDPSQEIKVGEITAEEQTKISKRTESFDFRTLTLGVSGFTNLKKSEKDTPNIYIGTGYHFEVTEQSFIRLVADLSWRQSPVWATFWNFGLGYGFFFKNAQQSPFAAVDIGYGGALCTGLDSESGMTLGGQLGYGFFRTSHKQLNVSLRYVQLLKANQEGNPSLLGAAVTVLF